ncbi:MAG: shikimate dehydrogenase [Muribaculaceae bacterium]|nr:shikimate dehydrogenase [Muribaculaceae bacterium]
MREFGLIGRGIGHSFSAGFFNDKFSREGIDARYISFDLEDISMVTDILATHPLIKGFNVTSPYKRDIIPILHSLSPEARELNAVNVVKVGRRTDGSPLLEGHNTDCAGFGLTLPSLLPPASRALVMGTGGASSAVTLALRKLGVPYLVVSRTPEGQEIGYEEMNRLLPGYNLLVNATPLGMHPRIDACPPVDFEAVGSSHICYDLIYNPPESLFLRKASEKGARTVNGLDMLINQANLSWEIWNS